jgi:hypothetical protein
MPQLELPSMRSSGLVGPGGQRRALLVSPTPRRAECILVLAPEAIIPWPPERALHVGVHLLARNLGGLRTRNELTVSRAEPLPGPPTSQCRRLARHRRPRCIDERKPIATPHHTHPEPLEFFMESVPRLDAVELGCVADGPTGPARKAL